MKKLFLKRQFHDTIQIDRQYSHLIRNLYDNIMIY
jgi:hypothetical protein